MTSVRLSDGTIARWLESSIQASTILEVMPDPAPEWLGVYFQRFDRETCTFVPNIEGQRNPFQRLLEANRVYTHQDPNDV
jgi:hypothetical protein